VKFLTTKIDQKSTKVTKVVPDDITEMVNLKNNHNISKINQIFFQEPSNLTQENLQTKESLYAKENEEVEQPDVINSWT